MGPHFFPLKESFSLPSSKGISINRVGSINRWASITLGSGATFRAILVNRKPKPQITLPRMAQNTAKAVRFFTNLYPLADIFPMRIPHFSPLRKPDKGRKKEPLLVKAAVRQIGIWRVVPADNSGLISCCCLTHPDCARPVAIFRSAYELEFGKLCLIEYVGAAIGRPCSEMLRIRIGLRRIQTWYRRTSNARPYTINHRSLNKFQFV